MLEWLTGAKETRHSRLGLHTPKREISPMLSVSAGVVLAILVGLAVGYLFR